MNESLNLEQSMQTVQRLSPRQVQFVRLLEMTAPEVEEEVRRQLDDNPALEEVQRGDEDADSQSDGSSMENEASEGGVSETSLPDNADPDDDPADYYYQRGASSAADIYQAPVADDSPDLLQALMSQLGQSQLSDRDAAIAAYIIGNIDENGYLSRSLRQMADDLSVAAGVEFEIEDLKGAYKAVRAMEPAGVGAADLRDCLLLQLDRRQGESPVDKLAREIVADNFDLLSKKHYEKLQSQLGVKDPDLLRKAIRVIQQLNPKPGSSIAASSTMLKEAQITPDVLVEVTDDGRFVVSLASRLPQLQVEATFSHEADVQPANKRQREAQAFVKLKRDDAEAFISALRQRAQTLITVTTEIVKIQREFFLSGDKSRLRPMILKDVAKTTGYDLSVVSRATAGKYVATDMGVYPLKMFFSEAPTDDTDASSHQLMHVMKQIIEGENGKHPYSDQELLEEMKRHGFDMARRTVTKYREKLGIPVARLRKSF